MKAALCPSSHEILSGTEIERITAQHLIETPLKPADLLFVFGTRSWVHERVSAALKLWERGFCKQLIVSGGLTPGGNQTECAIIKDQLVSAGVPGFLILEEHRATNTGENITFSLPILEEHTGLETIRSIICLGHFWAARRYAMTMHRHWPAVEKMVFGVNPFATPKALWHTDAELRSRVLCEWNKIEPYTARGFIADWPRP